MKNGMRIHSEEGQAAIAVAGTRERNGNFNRNKTFTSRKTLLSDNYKLSVFVQHANAICGSSIKVTDLFN